jgi:hypothetical protein
VKDSSGVSENSEILGSPFSKLAMTPPLFTASSLIT